MKNIKNSLRKKRSLLLTIVLTSSLMAFLPVYVKALSYDYKAFRAEVPVGIVQQGNYGSTWYNDNYVYEVSAITLWPLSPIFYFYVAMGVDFYSPSSSYPHVYLYIDYSIVGLWGCNLNVDYTDGSRDTWAVSGSHYTMYTLDSYKKVEIVSFVGYSLFIPGSVKMDYAMVRYQT